MASAFGGQQHKTGAAAAHSTRDPMAKKGLAFGSKVSMCMEAFSGAEALPG